MALPAEQADVAALLQGLAGGPALETHVSAVFLGPDTVWKLKKAVRFSFLDFSSPADRRRFLLRELELNRPAAPDLYRDVVPVVQTARGLALGGADDKGAVDWVLRMARVPASDFLDRVAAEGRLNPALLDQLADAVAGMHAALPPVPGRDAPGRLRQVIAGNAAAALAAGLPAPAVEAWRSGTLAAIEARAGLLARRAAAGLVRRAHGDLHLGNLLLWQGRPAPFDALEFDEDLATIDLGYDLAFLLMDLDCTLSRAAANRVLARYVARTGDAGLVGALLPFLALRAMVRAHVQGGHGPYLDAALAYLAPSRPVVVAVGGLMGSGKSTLARAFAPGLGPAPGALVLRSDEIRKRLHGVAPEQALGPRAYAPDAHARVEAALLEEIAAAAGGGHAVVVDASFMDPSLRRKVAAAARQAGLPFLGVWLHAPLEELERRVTTRVGDASDADAAVLRAAAARVSPPGDWLHVPATTSADAVAMVQEAVRRL